MQRTHQISDSSSPEDVLIIRKPYSKKVIRHTKDKRKLSVSLKAFKTDFHIFDPGMREKHNNNVIGAVMKLIFKKMAECIIKEMWRMPIPSGQGSMYIQQAQVTGVSFKEGAKPNYTALVREVHLGMKRAFLKWNKLGKKFPYKHIWQTKRSNGFYRSSLYTEVIDRANDQTKKNFTGYLT